MRVDHRDGRTIVDTAALAALTGRPATAVHRWCQRDDAGYDSDQAMRQLDGRPDPNTVPGSRLAAKLTGIPEGTIRSWLGRGQIRSLGQTPDGRTIFDLDELAARRSRPD